MFFTKSSNVAALVGAATLLTTCALAGPTILLPCGKGSVSQLHAIVPDSSCQKISDTGAFIISRLGDVEPGVQLAFSPTPDCQETFVARYDELVQRQESFSCQTYIVGKKVTDTNNDIGPDDKTKVYVAIDYQKKGNRSQQEYLDDKKINKRDSAARDWNGFWIKRDDGKGGSTEQQQKQEKKKQQQASGSQSDQIGEGQTALTYVMLVSA
ncbi:hypothetical protein NDA13_004800 [Ustilago tritici]|nr:hypothetical protein NDA13_004800 [Ustilago tritici]